MQEIKCPLCHAQAEATRLRGGISAWVECSAVHEFVITDRAARELEDHPAWLAQLVRKLARPKEGLIASITWNATANEPDVNFVSRAHPALMPLDRGRS